MAGRASQWLLCLSLFFLLAGCSVATETQRLGRFYNAVRAQPQIQPPADYVPSTRAAVGADPIAKADVVVFATRPGDAVVYAYATIRRAVEQGKRVVIVFVTDGDAQTAVAQGLADLPATARPTPRQFLHGAAVLQEIAVIVAVNALGLRREDVIFLSYPDGVLHEVTPARPDLVIRSPYTEKDGVHDPNITPYRILRSGHGNPYSYNAVLRDLNDVLVELNPRQIYLPSPASADETAAAAGKLVAQSLREVAPPGAQAFAYGRSTAAAQEPLQVWEVVNPAEKQRALDMFAARIGIESWPSIPPSLLEEEQFWQFTYAVDTKIA